MLAMPWFILMLLGCVAPACSSSDSFLGTEIHSQKLAPGFTLQDQFGQTVRLDDYFGKIVVLTFLYTACPDICPIVTNNLIKIQNILGNDATDVEIVIITVDPDHDTTANLLKYSERWNMQNEWTLLGGSRHSLEEVWADYYIDPYSLTNNLSSTTSTVGSGNVGRKVDALQDHTLNPNRITHSAPVYLIDHSGRIRVIFTLPIEPFSLVHDIMLLQEHATN